MKFSMEHADAIKGISENLIKMEKDLQYGRDQCLKIIGLTVKGNVQALMPRSNKILKKRPHMMDDVEFVIKTSNKGERYVSVRGGKKTGKLWHLVNDGHVAQDGTVVSGVRFVELAVQQSEKEIDDIINSFLEGVIDG